MALNLFFSESKSDFFDFFCILETNVMSVFPHMTEAESQIPLKSEPNVRKKSFGNVWVDLICFVTYFDHNSYMLMRLGYTSKHFENFKVIYPCRYSLDSQDFYSLKKLFFSVLISNKLLVIAFGAPPKCQRFSWVMF